VCKVGWLWFLILAVHIWIGLSVTMRDFHCSIECVDKQKNDGMELTQEVQESPDGVQLQL
jgi:hypothetical protein